MKLMFVLLTEIALLHILPKYIPKSNMGQGAGKKKRKGGREEDWLFGYITT